MGMGYAANFAEVVKEDFVKKIVGEELFDEFSDLVLELGSSDITELFANDEYENIEKDDDNYGICKVYKEIVKKFEKETGLGLYYNYHDSDDGDRYDDVSGAYWGVTGVYILSEAGKKYKEEIERNYFVTFG